MDRGCRALSLFASPTPWTRAGRRGSEPRMRDLREDIGPEVIDFVYSTLGIDDAWSVRAPRGFTWWGHRLAQRVWAEAPRVGHRTRPDCSVVRVHAETDLFRGVPVT